MRHQFGVVSDRLCTRWKWKGKTDSDPEGVAVVHFEAEGGAAGDGGAVDVSGAVDDGGPDGGADGNAEEGQEGGDGGDEEGEAVGQECGDGGNEDQSAADEEAVESASSGRDYEKNRRVSVDVSRNKRRTGAAREVTKVALVAEGGLRDGAANGILEILRSIGQNGVQRLELLAPTVRSQPWMR